LDVADWQSLKCPRIVQDTAWVDSETIQKTDQIFFRFLPFSGMYDCTKPKGSEQKSRKECLPDCKQQCAKTEAQLMKGTPKAQAVDMGI
jgi:hypothetical protein